MAIAQSRVATPGGVRSALSLPPARLYLSSRGRLVAALCLALGGLVLPWAGENLGPNLSAWAIHVSLASVPEVGRLSYGMLIVAIGLVAASSSYRHRWSRTTTARWCGVGMLSVAVLYLVTNRLDGGSLLFSITKDANESAMLRQPEVMAVPGGPNNFLGFALDPTMTLLLDSLRLGWYFTVAAGFVLAGTHRIVRPGPAGIAVAVVVTSVVAGGLVLGWLGQNDKLAAGVALSTGRPAAALADITAATKLLPQLDLDPGVERIIGRADLELGQVGAAADFAQATATAPNSASAALRDLELLSAATRLDPANPVISEQYDLSLAAAIGKAHSPVDVRLAEGRLSSVVVAYELGRASYDAGDEAGTLRYMRIAGGETDNAEIRSFALTYIALAEDRLGEVGAFRRDIVAAVGLDRQNGNVLAREVAAGLFEPPGA